MSFLRRSQRRRRQEPEDLRVLLQKAVARAQELASAVEDARDRMKVGHAHESDVDKIENALREIRDASEIMQGFVPAEKRIREAGEEFVNLGGG